MINQTETIDDKTKQDLVQELGFVLKGGFMDNQEQIFTIQQLSLKLNVSKPTLRFWEKELDGIGVPIRTSGNQRRYDLGHLAVIGKVKEMRAKGISLSEIKRTLGTNKKARDNHADFEKIDLLADRIALAVKAEVYSFLQESTYE